MSSHIDNFHQLLHTLNENQLRAVEHIEGPVLVIAGPGTGKTHILAARIGKILLETDTLPQSILCLSFTDAGVRAMRERLLDMIGPEAYRVTISTFHGFCNRVIQENLEYFGKSQLEPVTDLERIELVRGILSKLPTEHPLRAGKKDAFLFENQLRDLFSTMKKEGWTAGYVVKKVTEFLNELPSNPKYIYQRNTKHAQKGEPKTALVRETTERMHRLMAAADLYPKYLHAMERAGRYEYEDMILWVLQAFEKNQALLRTYQERYLYIQVDEFQDTNGAQYQLLRMLLDFWDTPNAFIVGDDDQSIFEFQGARLDNLRHFYQTYQPNLETIVLGANYRSSQDILDLASRVIENNTIRAVSHLDEPIQKLLQASTNEAGKPHLRVYENRLQELTHLVGQIENLIGEGMPPEQIAVIYARHKQANRLMTLLGKKGIPYQARRPVNILDLPLVQQLREFLCYLDEESRAPYTGEHRLFRLLHAGFFRIDAGDLARIAVSAAYEGSGVDDQKARYDTPVSRHQAKPGFWRQALTNPEFLQGLGLKHPEAFEPLTRNLNSWISAVHNLPLPQLLERLFTQSGLLQWVLQQPNKLEHLQTLQTFFDFAEAEVKRHPRLHTNGIGSLSRLLQVLDSMDDNRLPLPLQQTVDAGPGVQLLTAHSAKGLEFEQVFLFDCVEDVWEKSPGGNRGRFALPPALLPAAEEDALEARRRLFYVAMTRAKRRLHSSYSRTAEDGKPLTQSVFVEETGLPHEPATVSREALLETQALLMLEREPPVVALPEPVAYQALLRDFSLSITALNRYLRCPLAFYYEDFLKIPGAMSEAAAFGVAMHSALQQYVLKMKADRNNQFPAAEVLLRLFKNEMERQRGYFTENNFAQRLTLGREYLQRIQQEQIPQWVRRVIVERRIDRAELDGIPLSGVLDKIEWLDDHSLRLVDYKTGTPDARKTAPPDATQLHGGDYWRQMAFYQILIRQARLYPEPVRNTAVVWLEPDRQGAFPVIEINFRPNDLQLVENLIRETWAGIQAAHFSPGCGQDHCIWCRMHRWNEPPDVLVREEESLDDNA